jgi:MFS family permease
MMVPVGRLTLVRTFDRSQLVPIMSFVAIPALIGPMLGPIAGGLILRYLHWRYIFFLNLPIGLAGLVMVYLRLPDYREEWRKPLDLIGLILFGSGTALLSSNSKWLSGRKIIELAVLRFRGAAWS